MSSRRGNRGKVKAGRTALLAVMFALGGAGAAHAGYEPAQILSDSAATSTEFQTATEPAISADGQWVAFEGENEGLAGVWERNLQTGAISPVATVPSSTSATSTPDPTGPSISASGQFVAFTSETDPDPTDIVLPPTNFNCPEVYVRNMAIPAGQPGAYTLVAELDGGTTPITFAGCFVPGQAGDLKVGGAQASPGVAISADGQQVAFTVDSASNLGLPASDVPSPCTAPDTPNTTCPSQVAVRNLATSTTTVMSVTPQGAPVADGGAYPSWTSYPSSGWGQEDDQAVDMSQVGDVPASTAAISADGTTVAWMGTNLPSQLPAGDVTAGMTGNTHLVDPSDPEGQEVEPLWRRISGPGAGQTERLLAGAGLQFYGYSGYYSQDGAGNEPAIEGGSAEQDPGTPVLSANGDEVVVTSDAPSPARLAALGQYPAFVNHFLHSDAYAVSMANPSAPSVTPLTQITSDVASNGVDPSSDQVSGTVADPAISPDGTQIAFETDRTQFSLASPALVSPPVQFTQKSETYVADLATGTLQQATSTYNGVAPDGSSGLESVDNAGDVAVESSATNLVYGNVNLDGPEVYLLDNTPPSTAVATETLSAAPRLVLARSGPAKWSISASASARRSGTVALKVSVPGAGVVHAIAAAQLPGGGSSVARKRIPFRPVGAARVKARRRSVVRFTLALDRADRRYAAGRRGLYARIAVRFSANGHHAVRVTVPVTFRIRSAAPRHGASTAHRRGRRR